MAVTTLDLTKTSNRTVFIGSSDDDIVCAKAFWQSVQLQPTLESRLVSSDIKQRLKRAPPGNQSQNFAHSIPEDSAALQEFLMKAKTMEQMERYERLRQLASARDEDRDLLQKHRHERMKREQISAKFRPAFTTGAKEVNDATKEAADNSEIEDPIQTVQDLDQFDEMRNLNSGDSDSEKE